MDDYADQCTRSEGRPGPTALFGVQHALQEGAPPLSIKPYGILNLTAGVESADKHWRLELWGKNVTNKLIVTNRNFTFDGVDQYVGMPLTYGITLSLSH